MLDKQFAMESTSETCFDEDDAVTVVDGGPLHESSTSCSSQTRRSSDDEDEEDITTAKIVCELHPGRAGHLFCRTCSMVVCCACATSRHRICDCQDVGDVAFDCRRLFNDEVKFIDSQLRKHREKIDELNTAHAALRQECGTVEEQIRRYYEELRRRLEKDERQLLAEVESTKHVKSKELRNAVDDNEASVVKLDGYRERLSQLADSGTDKDVLAEHANGHIRAADLESVRCKSVDVVRLEFFVSKLVTSAENLVGQLTAPVKRTIPAIDGDEQKTRLGTTQPAPTATFVEWQCAVCTLLNSDDELFCRMCGNPRWNEDQPRTGSRPREVDQMWMSADISIDQVVTEPIGLLPAERSPLRRSPSPGSPGTRSLPDSSGCQEPRQVQGTNALAVPGSEPAQAKPKLSPQVVIEKLRRHLSKPGLFGQSGDSNSSSRQVSEEVSWTTEDCRMATWNCSRCTLENNVWATKCQACHYEEPSPQLNEPKNNSGASWMQL